jgi:hypothetical protein
MYSAMLQKTVEDFVRADVYTPRVNQETDRLLRSLTDLGNRVKRHGKELHGGQFQAPAGGFARNMPRPAPQRP